MTPLRNDARERVQCVILGSDPIVGMHEARLHLLTIKGRVQCVADSAEAGEARIDAGAE